MLTAGMRTYDLTIHKDGEMKIVTFSIAERTMAGRDGTTTTTYSVNFLGGSVDWMK